MEWGIDGAGVPRARPGGEDLGCWVLQSPATSICTQFDFTDQGKARGASEARDARAPEFDGDDSIDAEVASLTSGRTLGLGLSTQWSEFSSVNDQPSVISPPSRFHDRGTIATASDGLSPVRRWLFRPMADGRGIMASHADNSPTYAGPIAVPPPSPAVQSEVGPVRGRDWKWGAQAAGHGTKRKRTQDGLGET